MAEEREREGGRERERAIFNFHFKYLFSVCLIVLDIKYISLSENL